MNNLQFAAELIVYLFAVIGLLVTVVGVAIANVIDSHGRAGGTDVPDNAEAVHE